VQSPGLPAMLLAPTIAVPTGALMPQSRVEAAAGVAGAALDGLPGTTVGPRFCTDSTVRLPGSNQRGEQPSLRIEADSPRRGGQARAAAFPGYA
jgi:hypothetical protein